MEVLDLSVDSYWYWQWHDPRDGVPAEDWEKGVDYDQTLPLGRLRQPRPDSEHDWHEIRTVVGWHRWHDGRKRAVSLPMLSELDDAEAMVCVLHAVAIDMMELENSENARSD